jgi:hypothetical protein
LSLVASDKLRQNNSFTRLKAAAPVDPEGGSDTIYSVRKNDSEPFPEGPDPSARTLRVVVSATQFDWLAKQCGFLAIPKEQLVVDAMEEWMCRNREASIPADPSGMVRRALDEFMNRHRDEFLSME